MPSNAPDSIHCGDTVAITRDGARRLGKRRFTFPNCVDLWVRICVIFRNSLTGNIVLCALSAGRLSRWESGENWFENVYKRNNAESEKKRLPTLWRLSKS